MGKSLILLLNFLLLESTGFGQKVTSIKVCDCSNRYVRDSLVSKYIDNGAKKLEDLYNDPAWELYCDSVLTICPDMASMYEEKAIPFLKNGDYEKAFAFDAKAVELDPNGFTGYVAFLKCIFTKDYDGAKIDFLKAEELDPKSYVMDHTYPFYLGLCNLETGHYAEATEDFRQDVFIQTGGDTTKGIHYNTLFYIGILHFKMGDYAKAKEDLLRCIKEYDMLPEANYWLAQIYKKENNSVLEKKYLNIAKNAKKQGYSMNEGNLPYVYYPEQINYYEIEEGLKD